MEVLILINEDMRTVPRELCIHRNLIRQDLNYNESAALIDAHLKMHKVRTEADIVATQSSIDWINSDATSLVKDQGQNCRMYSTTEGIAVKTQQIIHCL